MTCLVFKGGLNIDMRHEDRFEVAEYRETLKEIEKILTSNMYNNEKVALRKIKELATITTMY